MDPAITSINGIGVVSIKDFGGIAPVCITPEKTLIIEGTNLNSGQAIAAIGLNEVGTETCILPVKNLQIGKSVYDLFELIGGVSIGKLGDIFDGTIFDPFLNDIDDLAEPVTRKADILRSPDVPVKSPGQPTSVNQLRAYVPSVWEFQTTDLDLFGFKCRYERNTIVMPFALCVWDLNTNAHSTPIIIAAMLPPPSVDKMQITDRSVLIGSVPGPSKDKTDHFGALIPKDSNNKPISNTGGEVRWYGLNQLIEMPSLDIQSLFVSQPAVSFPETEEARSVWDWLADAVTKPGQPVLGEVLKGLEAIRLKGVRLPVIDWHNEGVLFNLDPDTPFGAAGFAVVWRDDIPSKPVPILNLSCNCADPVQHGKIQQLLQEAACKLWSFMPQFSIDKEVLPGEAVSFGLQKLAQGMDNLIQRLLNSKESGITIKFKFTVDDQGARITKVFQNSGMDIRPGEYTDDIVPTKVYPEDPFQIKILARPELVSQASAAPEKYVTVKLYAEIAFLSSCVFSDIQIGPQFRFKQLPIEIPTLAVFFTGASCGKVPLFMLGDSTGILPDGFSSIHYDVDGIRPAFPLRKNQTLLDAMNEIRIKILSALTLAKNALGLATSLGIVSGPPWIEDLEGFLARLINAASFVIDTNQKIEDLGTCVFARDAFGASKFGLAIESVLLIGPPSKPSGKHFKCYTGLNGTGAELMLTIPQDTWVAALDNLRNFNQEMSIGNSTLPLIVCTEGGTSKAPTWGGIIASIHFK